MASWPGNGWLWVWQHVATFFFLSSFFFAFCSQNYTVYIYLYIYISIYLYIVLKMVVLWQPQALAFRCFALLIWLDTCILAYSSEIQNRRITVGETLGAQPVKLSKWNLRIVGRLQRSCICPTVRCVRDLIEAPGFGHSMIFLSRLQSHHFADSNLHFCTFLFYSTYCILFFPLWSLASRNISLVRFVSVCIHSSQFQTISESGSGSFAPLVSRKGAFALLLAISQRWRSLSCFFSLQRPASGLSYRTRR